MTQAFQPAPETATMRTPGDGSITKLRNGRFWVRSPKDISGKQKGLGTYETRELARDALDAFLFMHTNPGPRSASPEFAKFGREVLDLREEEGLRSVAKDRKRFECHLATSALATVPLTSITPGHVAELARALARKDAQDKRGRRKISTPTVQRVMSIGSIICDEAIRRTLISTNPFAGHKLRKRKDEGAEEVWTFLTLDEQRRIATCAEIPLEDRVIIRCCLGSGIRQGEMACNYLRDLHLEGPEPFLFVRYGSRKGGVDLTPKNKKPRKVPLFGDALLAFKEWLEIRKSYIRKAARHEAQTDAGLLFPTITGCRRREGKPLGNGFFREGHPRATANGWVDRLAHYYHLANVPDRPGLHWHALRHSCATSLLEGFWGPPWALEEVSQQLGHGDIGVTQRYAHPSGVRLRAAAARSAGYALGADPSYAGVTTGGGAGSSVAAISSDSEGSHLPGLNRRPAVYERPATVNGSAGIASKDPPQSILCNYVSDDALARKVLELLRVGQVEAAQALASAISEARAASTPTVAVA